jgi:hypothetical protein
MTSDAFVGGPVMSYLVSNLEGAGSPGTPLDDDDD